ncbi:MAG: DUF3592 domain-containing protein, partial [Verrucomicrobia bacterium]|nr:DUF3592 domain-containing protein [Verrucomicrobiota bacterium]
MMADKKSGFGCAFLFGLPFLLIGVCALAMMGWNIYDAMRMASWREAGATITSLNLEEHDTEDGSTQKIVATYTYVVDGQTHHGDRVAITTGSDNIGPYWKDLYRSLQDARSKGSAVCYVNPDDPREAVLDRHIRWGLIGFKAIFAVVFGGVGVAVCFGSFFVRRQEKAREALRLAEGDDAVWKVNKLWQNNRIRAEGGGGAWGLLFIAVIWNAISSPVLFFGIPEMLEEKEYVAIAICAIFPIIGVVLIILAVYHLFRWLKH